MWNLLPFSFLVLSTSLGVPHSPSPRIIGGDNAAITDYPYAVQIEYYELVCGGVLVAPEWVLTAGMCIYDKDLEVFIIRVGTTGRGDGGQIFNISTAILHPQYQWDNDDYNALLIHLNGTVTDPNTQLVEMVEAGSSIPVGSNIIVVGWGWVTEDYLEYDENFATTLQVLELPILDEDTCRETESQFGDYTETMFCAGYLEGGKGFCAADNGGPAMYQGRLIGLASWTDNCARANRPGVFTKVSLIRTWVDSIIST